MPDIPTTILLLVVVAVATIAARGPVRRRSGGEEPADRLGEHVLVAVSRPASAVPLGRFAAAIARPARGRVTPVSVLGLDAGAGARQRAEETVARCGDVVIEEGLDAEGRVRVDHSVADGLFHGAVEYDASSLVVGWPGGEGTTDAATELERLVSAAPVPVLVARLDGYRWDRIALRVPPEPNSDGLRASLRLATRAAERLAATTGMPVTCSAGTSVLRGAPGQLLIVPVDPDPEAIRRVVALTDFVGDVVLAICHGPRAREHRPLLPAAVELYDAPLAPVADARPRLVPSQEI